VAVVRSSWITAVRTRRLFAVLRAIPARPPGIRVAEARLSLWRVCGGSIDEVSTLIDVLIGAELVVQERAALHLSRAGKTVLARYSAEGLRALGLALLRAGYFHDQARMLLEMSSGDADGNLSCPTRAARQRCPQLVGILQFWSEVAVAAQIEIPTHLVRELETTWALLPPPSPDDAASDAARKNIGNRGELYSYQLERQNAVNQSDIVWVARDDSSLGYDIEDRSVSPRRRIEVKASGDTAVRFLLSDNEWKKSQDDPTNYEIHFWGGIDLNVSPAEEYVKLRSQAFPMIFVDLPSLITAGEFTSQPARWRLVRT
jgi:hypothetical protein